MAAQTNDVLYAGQNCQTDPSRPAPGTLWSLSVEVGDLIRVISPKIDRMLGGENPGIGIIVDVTTNMVRVQFIAEGRWQGQVKPLAKGWVEVIE